MSLRVLYIVLWRDNMNKIEKLINKYLYFLVTDYNFDYKTQSFSEYHGFSGPIYAYSFYNEYGCFTIHYIVQKDELSFFVSDKFYSNQYQLLEKKISLIEYISPCYRKTTLFKRLAASIRNQIKNKNSFFVY